MLYEEIEKSGDNIVFVYTMCGSKEEARTLGLSAVEEKLAISADYWITNSIYPWKNVVQEIEQYVLMISTQRALSSNLINHIESGHSYSIPMIVVCNTAMSNESYSLWVNNTLNDKDGYITKEQSLAKEKEKEEEKYIEKLK